MIIYKTTNLVNGKFYIGKSIKNNPKYLGSGVYIKRAIDFYGIENFKKEIIDTAESTKELNEKEIYWINKLGAQNKNIGYNLTNGGDGGNTIENFNDYEYELWKENVQINKKEWHHTEEQKEIFRQQRLNTEMSSETKNKISEANRFVWNCYSIEEYNRICNMKKQTNGLRGKHPLDVLIDKHGIEKANNMWKSRNEKISEKNTGENNPMYGKGYKIAGEKNGQYGNIGEKSPNWKKKHSKETKEKMRKSALERNNGTRTAAEKAAIKKGMAKRRDHFIRQIDRQTGEIVAEYTSVNEARHVTGISYHRIVANTHKEYEFLKIKK